MAVEITPKGTHGESIPSLPRPVMKVALAVFLASRRLMRMPLIEVTTHGAKTGARRTTHLRRFDVDENTWLVVASMGGAAAHPAWYFNMAKNPDKVEVAIDGRSVQVTPRSLHGAQRKAAWARIVAEAPQFAEYQTKTDRELPIVELRRVP